MSRALGLRLGVLLAFATQSGQLFSTASVRAAPGSAQPDSTEAAGTLSLVFAGDIMLDDLPGQSIAAGVDPFASFAATLASADFAIGNLECPVATGGSAFHKFFTFRADPRVVPYVARHFSAVTLANNHSGDYGKAALLETLQRLSSARLGVFGAGRDLEQAHAPLLLERNGLRVALLGYNEFQPRAFEATAETAGVAWSEDEQVVTDIRRARQLGADIVIPYMHWGWERAVQPCARQRELAQRMLDAGADAVIGAHPHVTQGVELYRGKPIIYSLGNFVFDTFSLRTTTTGWLARLEVRRGGVVRWETHVARLDERGLPHPDLQELSPCGDSSGIFVCRAGKRVTR